MEGGHYTKSYLKWSCELVSPESLIIYAKTEKLPLLMKWEVNIKDSQRIGWKVSIDPLLQNKVGDLYLTLFLTARYTGWASPLGKRSFSPRNIHAFEEIKLPDLKTKSIILFSEKEKALPIVRFSADNSSDIVPFVKWRNDLRAAGFYIKTKGGSSDKQNIFSGTISLLQGQTDMLN